jgi:hypothetical protein
MTTRINVIFDDPTIFPFFIGAVVVVIVKKLDLQLPICNQCLSPLKL